MGSNSLRSKRVIQISSSFSISVPPSIIIGYLVIVPPIPPTWDRTESSSLLVAGVEVRGRPIHVPICSVATILTSCLLVPSSPSSSLLLRLLLLLSPSSPSSSSSSLLLLLLLLLLIVVVASSYSLHTFLWPPFFQSRIWHSLEPRFLY